MRDGFATREEELGDQAPVAARPERLGAHEAGHRVGERFLEGALPLLRAHPRGVAPEGRDANAAEALLSRLAAAAAAELFGVAVRDAGRAQGLGKRRLAELRVPPRAGKPAHGHEGLDVYLTEAFGE